MTGQLNEIESTVGSIFVMVLLILLGHCIGLWNPNADKLCKIQKSLDKLNARIASSATTSNT